MRTSESNLKLTDDLERRLIDQELALQSFASTEDIDREIMRLLVAASLLAGAVGLIAVFT